MPHLSAEAGGIQLLLARLLPHLADGFEHQMVSLSGLEGVAASLGATGVAVRALDLASATRRERIARLAGEFTRERIDIVHAHDRHPSVLGMEAARQAGIAGRIVHYHTPHAWLIGKEEMAEREFAAVRHARRLLFCSPAVRDDVLTRVPRLGEVPSEILPNVVDLERFHPRGEGASAGAGGWPVIGALGRLTEAKNQGLLIEAAGRLRDEGLHLEVWLVGGGAPEYIAALREQAERWRLTDRVRFAGYQSDAAGVLRQLDVLAHPSRFEGMSLVILEAWASGVPVVAARVAGLRDMIRDGVDGVLCEPDDAESLSRAIRRLVEDAALREALRRGGIERAREHSAPSVAARLREIYREALDRPRRGGVGGLWDRLLSETGDASARSASARGETPHGAPAEDCDEGGPADSTGSARPAKRDA